MQLQTILAELDIQDVSILTPSEEGMQRPPVAAGQADSNVSILTPSEEGMQRLGAGPASDKESVSILTPSEEGMQRRLRGRQNRRLKFQSSPLPKKGCNGGRIQEPPASSHCSRCANLLPVQPFAAIFPPLLSSLHHLLTLKPLEKRMLLAELLLREPRAQPVSTPGSRFSSIGMINRMAIGQVIFNTWKTI